MEKRERGKHAEEGTGCLNHIITPKLFKSMKNFNFLVPVVLISFLVKHLKIIGSIHVDTIGKQERAQTWSKIKIAIFEAKKKKNKNILFFDIIFFVNYQITISVKWQGETQRWVKENLTVRRETPCIGVRVRGGLRDAIENCSFSEIRTAAEQKLRRSRVIPASPCLFLTSPEWR